MTRHAIRSILTSLAAVAIGACAASELTGVGSQNQSSVATRGLLGGNQSLVQCPSNTTVTASGLVTPLGGVVSAGGTTITVPAGALLEAANISVTVPASNYMEVDVSVSGVDHFTFQLPVAVVIDYSRCSRSNIDRGPLTAWYIDSDTHAMLEPMPSVDNKLLRTVTFTTGHLSGYALAN